MSFRLRMIEIIKEFLNTTQGKANFKYKKLKGIKNMKKNRKE